MKGQYKTVKNGRENRVRMKIKRQSTRPRLTVFRSNKYLYAQIIDDQKGTTLAAVSQKKMDTKGTGMEIAKELGKRIVQKAKKKNISEVVFDRGSFAYHGKVKSLADGAREEGLVF